MQTTLILSVKPRGKEAYIHPYHLGTDMGVARKIAEETFVGQNRHGMLTESVAILAADTRRIRAVYDGKWNEHRA